MTMILKQVETEGIGSINQDLTVSNGKSIIISIGFPTDIGLITHESMIPIRLG